MKNKNYTRKDINCNPQHIDLNNWFYDGKTHLTFIHEVFDKDKKWIQTDEIKVSIKQLANFISEMK